MFIIIKDTSGRSYGINPEYVEFVMETEDPQGKVNGAMIKLASGKVIDAPYPFAIICETISRETTKLRGIEIIDEPPENAEKKL